MKPTLSIIFLVILFGLFLGSIVHWMDIVNFLQVNFPSGYPLDQSIHSQAVMEFCALPSANCSLTRSLVCILRRMIPFSFNVKQWELRFKNLHQAKPATRFSGQLIFCYYVFYQFSRTDTENDVDASLLSPNPILNMSVT